MSNDLMKELSVMQAEKRAEDVAQLVALIDSAARGEAVDAAEASAILGANGIDVDAFKSRVNLKKRRIEWEAQVKQRPTLQARYDELTAAIDKANAEAQREQHREISIRKLLEQRLEVSTVPLERAAVAESQLQQTFPGRKRLDELRPQVARGRFATDACEEAARAELQALEAAELLP